jgi:O-antigen ligase
MNATTTVGYAPKQIPNPRAAIYVGVGLVLSIILSVVFNLPMTLALIFGAQLVLFSLATYRKVFVVASLLVGQLTASNFMIDISGTLISVRFIWTVLAIIALIILHFKENKTILGKRVWKILVPAIVLVSFGIISNAINTDLNYTLQYLRVAATALVIILIIPAVIEEEKDVKILGMVALITCIISGAFAIMQHYHFNLLPMHINIFGTSSIHGTRAIGLNDSAVDLSFTLPLVLLPAITLLFFKVVDVRYRILFILAILVMAAGQYLSFTRSGMYAMGAGLVALPLFMNSKKKWHIFAVVLVIIASFAIYTNIKGNRYTEGVSNDSSAAGRLVLWQAGAKIAMASPVFGIGGSAFKQTAEQYINSVTYDPNVVQATDVLGVEQPHNDFLRIWVSYGTVALIAFIWLLISVFRNYLISYRHLSSSLLKGIALGCFTAFVAYAVNAFTHNVIDEVPFIWVFAGFSIALCKLASIEKQKQIKASA